MRDLNATLALLNALFTSAMIGCALTGWRFVKRKDVARHRRWMLVACACGAAFLVSFVTRIVLFGFTEFVTTSKVARAAHLVLFAIHDGIAVATLPLVIAALLLALTHRYAGHRDVARIALPVWMAGAVTGLVLYVMLYG